jgi:hypothetical protein
MQPLFHKAMKNTEKVEKGTTLIMVMTLITVTTLITVFFSGFVRFCEVKIFTGFRFGKVETSGQECCFWRTCRQ